MAAWPTGVHLSCSLGLTVLAVWFASTQLTSCQDGCQDIFVGSSSFTHILVQDWPYGTGTAEGAWKLTLTPNGFGTNCVEVAAGSYPSESYYYALQFQAVEGSTEETQIFVESILFAAGSYQDAPPDSDVPDELTYQTGERIDESRPGGQVTYIIEGQARLEDNRVAGTLNWTGYELIRVLDSRDPSIKAGCEFLYDTSGVKVCDE